MARRILAGVLAAAAMFAWGFFSHAVLGLTDRYVKSLPNEAATLEGFRASIPGEGFFVYPGLAMDAPKEQQQQAMSEWAAAYQRGPRGILVYQPRGANPSYASLFGRQFLISLAVAFSALWLLRRAVPTLPKYWYRVCFVANLGLLASLLIDLPYWNWWSFPAGYTLSVLLDRTLAMACAGLVLAYFVRPQET